MADPSLPQADETQAAKAPIYQLRIDLLGIRPPIWRRLLVPSEVTLDVVHAIIQVAMGWSNYHLHVFTYRGVEIGDPTTDDWGQETIDERGVRLSQVLAKAGDKLTYEYDFGDGWVHTLKLEKVLPRHPETAYPVCVTGRRACPPEDVGGIWGYADFLEALSDEYHPRHNSVSEWIGGAFDSEAFDADEVTTALQGLSSEPTVSDFPFDSLTVVRLQMLSPELSATLLAHVTQDYPEYRAEARQLAARIDSAPTVAAWLDLLPLIATVDTRLTTAWVQRIASFAPHAAPLIVAHMAQLDMPDASLLVWSQERMAVALQRLGPPAASALRAAFDTLDDYCKALACVVIGQVGAREHADLVWDCFEALFEGAETCIFMGPLWALTDLEDARAAEAVARAIDEGWDCLGLAAIAGRVGDRRSLVPLLQWLQDTGEPPAPSILAATSGVARRIGRDAIIAEFEAAGITPDPDTMESNTDSLVELLLSQPPDLAATALDMFFTPQTLDDVRGDIDRLDLLL